MSKKSAVDLFKRAGTKRRIIGELCEQGKTAIETLAIVRPLVIAQTPPFVFKANPAVPGGHRVPKPIAAQLSDLQDEINRVYALMGRSDSTLSTSAEIPTDPPLEIEQDTPTETESEETPEEIEDAPEKPAARGKVRMQSELERFATRMRGILDFCKLRASQSEAVDDLGNRPYLAASKLIPAGIPVEALLDVMTRHWEADMRNDVTGGAITPFDFVSLSREIGESRGIDMHGKHEMFPYVLTLVENAIPVYLHGPQGSGKSTLCRQIAEYLDVEYGETACSAGATRGDFYGRLTASSERPFILAKFAHLYPRGGVFNFEEIDAALPEVLIALNNALAGKEFYNSSNGETYKLSDNFYPMATANTLGLGDGGRLYIREKLDAASLDRWRMGRTFIDFDLKLAENILFGRV